MTDPTIRRTIEEVRAKNIEPTQLFVDSPRAVDSMHKGKMKQIILTYSMPKETVTVLMMLYRNMKVKVRSPNGDTDSSTFLLEFCMEIH